jgi:putative membrane protein
VWLVFIAIGIFVYTDAEKKGMNGLLWLFLIIIPWFGILFFIIYLAIREDNTKLYSSQKGAIAILEERYAKGNITSEDYHRMKKNLTGGG